MIFGVFYEIVFEFMKLPTTIFFIFVFVIVSLSQCTAGFDNYEEFEKKNRFSFEGENFEFSQRKPWKVTTHAKGGFLRGFLGPKRRNLSNSLKNKERLKFRVLKPLIRF